MTGNLWKEAYDTEGQKLSNGVTVYNLSSIGAPKSMYWACCFGFFNNELYIGGSHHAAILYEITSVQEKYDLMQIFNFEQKWGWARCGGEDSPIMLSFTTDEAKQTEDPKLSAKCAESFQLYFNHTTELPGNEGHSTVTEEEYGNRMKHQYLGEGSYCDNCGEYYDPDEEGDHERYCNDCDHYYYTCDHYDAEEHQQPYCADCGEHVPDLDEHNEYEHFEPEEGMPEEGQTIEYRGKQLKVEYIDYQGMHVLDPVHKSRWILTWEDWKNYQAEKTGSLKKQSDWLLSWVYDVTTGEIRTGHDHVNIIPYFDNWEMKMMENDFICGWYVHEGGGSVTTRIATDTVPQEHADKNHEAVEKAKKAAMEYWSDNDLGEDYGTNYETCPGCGEEYDPDWGNDHEQYCNDCDNYYYACDWNNQHEDPYCEDCGEHVPDLDEHNDDYHYSPEPGMPREGEHINWQGQEYKVWDVTSRGLKLMKLLPGGMEPQQYYNNIVTISWEDYKKSLQPQLPETHPNQMDFSNANPYLWQDYFLNQQPTSSVNWTEPDKPAIIHIVDLNDMQVFAKLSYDYLGNDEDVDWFNFHKNQQDQLDATQDQDSDWAWTDPAKQQQSGDSINQDQTFTPNENDFTPTDTSAQPDDPRMLTIARDWDSDEYRWSYDGHQLHMWRVYNRSAYGPSHYDMFGSEGYDNHSQGRVYVSDQGKVGMLYWQITHPECEAVLNEWCEKTFGKLPDYVYRAYGPYMGKPVSRWDFPIVEIGSLPLYDSERWWEKPNGYPGMTTDYPAKKKKNKGQQSLKDAILDRYNAGPVDDQGQPVTPGKKKRRRRTRNRKYRNRGFRR